MWQWIPMLVLVIAIGVRVLFNWKDRPSDAH